jgi:hypothetical protein
VTSIVHITASAIRARAPGVIRLMATPFCLRGPAVTVSGTRRNPSTCHPIGKTR